MACPASPPPQPLSDGKNLAYFLPFDLDHGRHVSSLLGKESLDQLTTATLIFQGEYLQAESIPVRCMHLNPMGWRCPAEALEGSDFCAIHRPFFDAEMTEPKSSRPLLYRLAALALLLIFLLNAYQTLRAWLGR